MALRLLKLAATSASARVVAAGAQRVASSTFLKRGFIIQTVPQEMGSPSPPTIMATVVWRNFTMIREAMMATVTACSPGCTAVACCSTQMPWSTC
ncbi:NADH:ubiquinone oxidoreductase subunit A10 [Homo sapiens]|uniref:NADH:ubiquinone oxidoreductase subunit A10 n=1 Tax=Homo sapiens TaxID=9606 RepID=A0A7I2V2Q2_HUMAN|nr:NADH:ubiquinone oxidoreductase subunit A10 [Homo sapiens]